MANTKLDQKRKLVSIVVPFYNEVEGIEYFYESIISAVDKISDVRFEVVCVDDGSSDDSLTKLIALSERDSRFCVVELSRNFGKEAALTAGMDMARGDAIIPMDADLQDPPELIPMLINEWQQGAEVVLARRTNRDSDNYLKRKPAELFYRIHNRVSSIKIKENVGDFRLMDRCVVEAIKQLPERQRFMKGIFAWVGFKTTTLNYARKPRKAGTTKFSGWKLWNFALEGITSFSIGPLKVWTYIGSIGAFIAFSYAVFIILRTLIYGKDLPGYASLLVVILFLGSLQLISVGILGEYMGRIYMETKQRPTYIIRKYHESNDES